MGKRKGADAHLSCAVCSTARRNCFNNEAPIVTWLERKAHLVQKVP